MRIFPIRNDEDHRRALAAIEQLSDAAPGSNDEATLEAFVTLVDAYEERHHAILPPSPIDAIRFRLEQMGLTRKDLEPFIGTRGRVSEVLAGRRALTLTMIRKLVKGLRIPAEVLVMENAPPARKRRAKHRGTRSLADTHVS